MPGLHGHGIELDTFDAVERLMRRRTKRWSQQVGLKPGPDRPDMTHTKTTCALVPVWVRFRFQMKMVSWIDSMEWEDKKDNPSPAIGLDTRSR
jgi:hypothetical protein